MQLTEFEHILNGLQYFPWVKEGLLCDIRDVLIVKISHFFEISCLGDRRHELGPLGLDDIQLKVGVEVIQKEGHMLAKEHGLAEGRVRRMGFHRSDLRRPDLLEF